MDHALSMINAGDVNGGMLRLFKMLRERRLSSSDAAWQEFVATQGMTHPIRQLIHQEPFTYRAFAQPRGYPGDAVTLDYMYRFGSDPVPPSIRPIHDFLMGLPAARAVRYRRQLLAEMIEAVAQRCPSPRVLALAAGHLREAELSHAVRSGQIAEYIALDQDRESLDVVEREYGGWGVRTVHGTIRQVLSGALRLRAFDFVYAAGLFDYLAQPVAKSLAKWMFGALKPGGQLLLANFLPGIHDVGYMESLMAWKLIYRTEAEILDLLAGVPRRQVRAVRISYDEDENLVFLVAERQGGQGAQAA